MTQVYTFITPEIEQAVLHYIAQGYSITGAASKAGTNYQALYYHRQVNPEFSQAIKDAIERGSDNLEDLMLDKARDPKGFLANMACLRARRPDKWSDKAQERQLLQDTRPNISITINVPSLAELPEALRQIVPGDIQMLPESVDNDETERGYDGSSST